MSYRQDMLEIGLDMAKSGKYVCPKCSPERKNKTDKSLSVTFEDKGVLYKCHNSGCEFSGFIGYEIKKYKVEKKNYTRPSKPIVKTNKEKLYEYFVKRGISKETIDLYQVGVTDKNEIVFPYYKNEVLVNNKYRINEGDGKKTFRQEKDAEKTFYGMDLVPNSLKELIIVEGEIDVLSLYECGKYAVSVPQGASEVKLECLDNCYAFIESFETYIIAVDDDETGHKLRDRLIERLGMAQCKIVKWKDFGGKDANEVLLKDKNSLEMGILLADYVEIEGIEGILENKDAILDFYHNGYSSGISTGWNCLDEIFTIKTKHLMVVTGIPTHGKSFFIDNMIYNLTTSNGWRHLICSMEMTTPTHFARFAEFRTGKHFGIKNNNTFKTKMTEMEVLESIEYFDEYIKRYSLKKQWTIDEIIEYGEYAVRRYGIKTLTIDPYNKLDHPIITTREDKYIDLMLSKLITFARKNDVLVIFIAHPKKLEKDTIPNLYSISGGSSWYNMADYGIIIHREKDSDGLCSTPEIIVQKVKDFHLGEPTGGSRKLQYSATKRRLIESKELNKPKIFN